MLKHLLSWERKTIYTQIKLREGIYTPIFRLDWNSEEITCTACDHVGVAEASLIEQENSVPEHVGIF